MFKKRQIPHTYVIVFFFIVLSAALTWVMPGGEYVEVQKEVNGEVQKVMEFQPTEAQPQTWEVFAAMFKGFERQAGIIVFILMIGGAFWIMNDSKAIDVGIYAFLRMTKKLERNKFMKRIGVDNIIIAMIMIMFSVFGAVFGMSEETIAFIIIFVPMAITMGYDSLVGVSMCFVAAGLGFAGAILNPFTIGIAQGLAEIPLFSGIEYRMFAWLVINIIGITYVLRYAHKVKKHPEKSIMHEQDKQWRDRTDEEGIEKLKYRTPKAAWAAFIFLAGVMVAASIIFPESELKVGNSSAIVPAIPIVTGLFIISSPLFLRKSVHFFILNLLIFTIIYLIVGVMGYGWYIMEIATLFFAMGIFAGIAMSKTPNEITNLFLAGTKDIMSAALIVGLAGGIIAVLEDGKVIDSILHSLASGMNEMGKVASVGVMYVIQNVINIVIPSGSAKAALTMPIMAPFSDLIGISRQATVVAFQFGDGFTNMITPTSGVLIGVLGVAKIPYDKWVRWVWPLITILIIVGFLLLIPTVTMDLSGF
ncbi:Putative p-aminobenzoyl-glutamate transporter [Salinivirga cyanobacteriivorans]|uniref:p-aminobenzoyl-glutamate transporter n=1 Tax=Salinivirga cyanobacteriivorans TaxID=1307839 RepID=A0A0S2I4M5_9BACT|nr:AbgT family transporter [Salinivirga cyanobacteriivorans]ALO17368.1 Putative p-aminobenzoyl-glutamate transporter [Salinivirga cyanobacteriivorans]